MQAFRLHRYEGLAACRLEDVAEPTPGPGEVAIRVRAAGVNPVDWKIAEGAGELFGCALPLALGCDVAGEVHAVGAGVTRFAPGDAVAAYVNLKRCGAFAEVCLAKDSELAAVPEGVEVAQAAGLPVAALTAHQAFFDVAHLQRGQRVLIHAASGGVGSLAVQLAKHAGAEVFATASARNEEFVRELGADEFIDYRSTAFDEVLSELDVVLDAVGGETQTRSLGVLKRQGVLVSIVGQPDGAAARERGVHAHFHAVRPDGATLGRLLEQVREGTLWVAVAKEYPLAQAEQALERSKTGRVRGKLVIRVTDA